MLYPSIHLVPHLNGDERLTVDRGKDDTHYTGSQKIGG